MKPGAVQGSLIRRLVGTAPKAGLEGTVALGANRTILGPWKLRDCVCESVRVPDLGQSASSN
jgi:hypothetical protein